jgi:hypothetical protein
MAKANADRASEASGPPRSRSVALQGPQWRSIPDVTAQLAGWNVALTVLALVTATEQTGPTTLVQPDHDVKIEPASGAAVNVTTCAGVVFATLTVHTPLAQVSPSPPTLPFPIPDVRAVTV